MLRLSTNCRRARFGEVYFVRGQPVKPSVPPGWRDDANLFASAQTLPVYSARLSTSSRFAPLQQG